MSIRSEILSQFKEVAQEQDKRLMPLADELPLAESGLDSLCLAVIVARLEDRFGVDPFSAALAEDAQLPVTMGEFIRFYEDAAK